VSLEYWGYGAPPGMVEFHRLTSAAAAKLCRSNFNLKRGKGMMGRGGGMIQNFTTIEKFDFTDRKIKYFVTGRGPISPRTGATFHDYKMHR